MEIPIWGVITGIIIIIGGLSTSVALLGKLMSKAAKEALQQKDIDDLKKAFDSYQSDIKVELKNYVRKEIADQLKIDLDGVGRKVIHLENDHKLTSEKVIGLESTLIAKVDSILEMLKQHIAYDNRNNK